MLMDKFVSSLFSLFVTPERCVREGASIWCSLHKFILGPPCSLQQPSSIYSRWRGGPSTSRPNLGQRTGLVLILIDSANIQDCPAQVMPLLPTIPEFWPLTTGNFIQEQQAYKGCSNTATEISRSTSRAGKTCIPHVWIKYKRSIVNEDKTWNDTMLKTTGYSPSSFYFVYRI
jgi:hypothetical protein